MAQKSKSKASKKVNVRSMSAQNIWFVILGFIIGGFVGLVTALAITSDEISDSKDKQSKSNDEKQSKTRAYIGLTEGQAVDKAKQEGLTHRVVERDGESFPITMDFSTNRINFSVRDGEVIKAELY